VTNCDRVALQAPINEVGNGLDNSDLIDAFRAARIAAAVSEQQQQQQQQGGQHYDNGRFSGAAQQQVRVLRPRTLPLPLKKHAQAASLPLQKSYNDP